MTVDFWNVGQADASSITWPNGEITIIDTGRKPSRRNPSQFLDWLAKQPNCKVNNLILTHNDIDHAGGLEAIVNMPTITYNYCMVIYDRQNLLKKCPAIRSIPRSKLARIEVSAREPVLNLYKYENYSLVATYPYTMDNIENLEAGKSNWTSAILLLLHNDQILVAWAGDNLLEIVQNNLHFAKANPAFLFGPHHGAPQDSNESIFNSSLDHIRPHNCCLSFATVNGYNHPNVKYIEALCNKNCNVICIQKTKACTHGRAGHGEESVIDGDGSYKLLTPRSPAVQCHGHVRLLIDKDKIRDELADEYASAKAAWPNRLCCQ